MLIDTRLDSFLLLLLAGAVIFPAAGCTPDDEQEPAEEVIIVGFDDDEDDGSKDEADMPAADEPDMQPEPDMKMEEPPSQICDGSGMVNGAVYFDEDNSSKSYYFQKIGDEDTPLAERSVNLIGADGVVETTTCADGAFGFGQLEDGNYVIEPIADEGWITTSGSMGQRFAEATREGELKIVVFGDSIPAYGPKPWWPSRLADMTSELAETDLVNVAVPGSRSFEWLPGTGYYNNRLATELGGADLIVFSLGGNDLYELANMDFNSIGIDKALPLFEETVDKIIANLKTIITQIRVVNPDADIVWLLYPNYATTNQWRMLAGDLVDAIQPILKKELIAIRRRLAHYEGLMIWDIYSATKDVDIDMFLIDPLHLNNLGHDFYARELFKMLGGVVVEQGSPSFDDERLVGFGQPVAE